MAVKIYTGKNVHEAALERVRWLFDEFEEVVVGYSGGKDSTVCFNLSMQVAREKGRLPLKVMFLDQEAEWQATIDQVTRVMEHPDVEPMWFQIPIKLFNATSGEDQWLQCWDAEAEDRWMRPRWPRAYTENVYGTDRFAEAFERIFAHHFKGVKACYISGVRCEESPTRELGLTHYATYKWATWGKRLDRREQHYTMYPLYDWSWIDVWKAIHDGGWDYNAIYDLQYQHGVAVREMRVSNVHHETAVGALFFMQEAEPDTYERLVQRIGGIDMAAKMGADDYFVRELPPMFKDWREYRDHLLKNLIQPDNQPKYAKLFADHERRYEGELGERIFQAHVQTILTNDIHGTKISTMDRRPEFHRIRRAVRNRRTENAK